MQEDTQRPEPSAPGQPESTPPSPATPEPQPRLAAMPAESVPAIPIPTPTPAPAPASAAVEPRGLEELQQPREVQPPFVADVVEPVYLPMTLTVGAGFKFGCGVLLAIAFAALALFLLFSVIFFVATLMGIPLPVGGT